MQLQQRPARSRLEKDGDATGGRGRVFVDHRFSRRRLIADRLQQIFHHSFPRLFSVIEVEAGMLPRDPLLLLDWLPLHFLASVVPPPLARARNVPTPDHLRRDSRESW